MRAGVSPDQIFLSGGTKNLSAGGREAQGAVPLSVLLMEAHNAAQTEDITPPAPGRTFPPPPAGLLAAGGRPSLIVWHGVLFPFMAVLYYSQPGSKGSQKPAEALDTAFCGLPAEKTYFLCADCIHYISTETVCQEFCAGWTPVGSAKSRWRALLLGARRRSGCAVTPSGTPPADSGPAALHRSGDLRSPPPAVGSPPPFPRRRSRS